MLSLSVAALSFVLAAGGDVAACGPPKAKAVEFFCPVGGLPKTKGDCCCPGGYCPKKPSAKVVAEHQGQKVQLCCRLCAPLFKKSPEKFAALANHQLAARALAKQKACPLCGDKADAKHAIDVAGVRVHLCSAECKKKAEGATARELVDRVFGTKPFAKGFTVAAKN
jgi:YHS domain-containing protein